MLLCCQKTSMDGSQNCSHITVPKSKDQWALLQWEGVRSERKMTNRTQGEGKTGVRRTEKSSQLGKS